MAKGVRLYRPTPGDIAYRDAKPDLDSFNDARMLRDISGEYLSVLLEANKGNSRAAGYVAMLEAEVMRRQSAIAVRANRIATWSLVASIVAAVAAIISIFS